MKYTWVHIKRAIVCVVMMLISVYVQAQDLNLNDVRRDFNKGVKNEDLCEKYHKILEKEADTPIEKGYGAAFHMFMAKHTSNPIKKMSYFNGGKKLLEKQIANNPNNIELRFIRLCIQYYVPGYLGYNSNIEEDKIFVMHNLYKMSDENTKDIIYNYLKGAKMYKEEELALLGR
ncbi:hypothetical protein [Sphingobacterium lumbrici]|uniref:hypothetical protein n=1 Tax=Sphingobacterium lumbrici TaxID=2559600 RepID=UPI00112992A7|nr:hypothetical protein [Sphingobacterium lumbrici]